MTFILILATTLGAGIFAKKKGIPLEAKTIAMVLVIEAVGIGLWCYDYWQSEDGFSEVMERPDTGKPDREEELIVHTPEQEQEWTVSVSSRSLSPSEAEKVLDEAIQEIRATFLGENASEDEVTGPVVPRETYVNGLVEAAWEYSEVSLIATDGRLQYEHLEEVAPVTVQVTAKLSCFDREKEYTFPLLLVMPQPESPEGFAYFLEKVLGEADAAHPAAAEFSLPAKVEDIPLDWTKKQDDRGVFIAILGLVAGVGIVLGRLEEERRKKQKIQKALSADYPDIVSSLSLYVSAGITVRSSFGRIFAGYQDRKRRTGIRDRPGYEAIGKVVRQMEDGVGEESAYRALGRMTGHRNYSKLSMMLTKHLKHGSTKLAAQLEKEEAQAFDARKLAARTQGEEASTKLLAPMMMLLSVVIVVLVAPAMLNMGMG
ncbi:MAG: hypothetical protein IJV04_01045 [Lachnospiraceae bacterium]|nr:hypothetical protein [Lachnospiraceae bacterium]